MRPKIKSDFILIINYEKPIFASVLASYINTWGYYTPTFTLGLATASRDEFDEDKFNEDNIDEHQISRTRTQDFNISVSNFIKRVGGCEYLILAGLTENQISYLDFKDGYNVLYIDTIDEVDVHLSHIVEKKEYLVCKEEDASNMLHTAIENNQMLRIDNSAKEFQSVETLNRGLVVVENSNASTLPLGISYAASIEASCFIIEESGTDKNEIRRLIQKWKTKDANGNENLAAFNDLSACIYPQIEHIDFDKYDYVTFFTNGIPYGLIIKNCIPVSHVHLRLLPDFFIFNNICIDGFTEAVSAVVFSPLEFADEETNNVIDLLNDNKFFVKSLVGENATVFNLDNHVKEYPYSILHICSHGGEIEGCRITEEFEDRDGTKHIVEYDEVFGFAISPFEKLIPVTTKSIWRKFDGYLWRSPELKAQDYPSYVFADMLNYLHKQKEKDRSNRVIVDGSCHIKCSDSIYQAMFRHLAAGHSPLIYNNICWSWSDIADSFIGVGARGYIGTLWAVDNGVATKSAELFYKELFSSTILEAFHKMLQVGKGSKDENIYIYWGLHFSSIISGVSVDISRKITLSKMLRSLEVWETKLKSTKNPKMAENINRFIRWNKYTQIKDFRKEILDYMKKSR